MPVNHVRRHRSHRDDPVDLGRRRTERVTQLLALRDHIAVAHASYEAHGIDGALGLLQEQLEIEWAIKSFAPHVYEQRWTSWLEDDASLMHDETHPHPKCRICVMQHPALAAA